MKCPFCGENISDGAVKCPNCSEYIGMSVNHEEDRKPRTHRVAPKKPRMHKPVVRIEKPPTVVAEKKPKPIVAKASSAPIKKVIVKPESHVEIPVRHLQSRTFAAPKVKHIPKLAKVEPEQNISPRLKTSHAWVLNVAAVLVLAAVIAGLYFLNKQV